MYCGKCNSYIPENPSITACLQCGCSISEAVALSARIKEKEPLVVVSSGKNPDKSVPVWEIEKQPFSELYNAVTFAKIRSKAQARYLLVMTGIGFYFVALLQVLSAYFFKYPIFYVEAAVCIVLGLCLQVLKSRVAAVLCILYSVLAIVSMVLGLAIARNVFLGLMILAYSIRATQASFALHTNIPEKAEQLPKEETISAMTKWNRFWARAGKIFAVLMIIGFGACDLYAIKNLIGYPQKPIVLTVNEAVEASKSRATWAEITDAKWNCEGDTTISDSNGSVRYIPLAGADPNNLIIYDVPEKDLRTPCSELVTRQSTVTGNLNTIYLTRQGYFKRHNTPPTINSYDFKNIRELDPEAGPNEARMWVVGMSIFVLLGIGLFAYCSYLLKKNK